LKNTGTGKTPHRAFIKAPAPEKHRTGQKVPHRTGKAPAPEKHRNPD
jgi:hypothetical protein